MANKNFVVKNGIEVNTNLIFADGDQNRIGIGTTNLTEKLTVDGGIESKSLNVIGVGTVTDLTIDGKLSVGNTSGQQGQYLVSTGLGVTWKSIGSLRQTTTFTATNGQTTFPVSYTLGYIDVYINGVKLTTSEYTATDGNTVVLDDPCFGDETVEFISYEAEYPFVAPITIELVGSQVIFNAVGIGSTALTLF